MNQISIIGAGAAGLMAAIQCANLGLKAKIYDSQNKIGKKILISGGGRCNITNKIMSPDYFHGSSKKFIKNILKNFNQNHTLDFFEKLYVPLKLETEFNKYFPLSNKSKDILEALLNELKRNQVELLKEYKLTEVKTNAGHFELHFSNGETIESKFLILATGGLSVPQTGSDGSCFEILKKIGHYTTKLTPSLAPLQLKNENLLLLKGYSLPAEISFYENNIKKCSFAGPILFTHFGISGPLALNISRHYLNSEDPQKKLTVNWCPNWKEEQFKKEILNPEISNKTVMNFLKQLFSKNMCEMLLKESQIPLHTKLNEFSKNLRKNLIQNIYHFPLQISGSKGFAVAEATAGGIPEEDLKPNTLESKIHKNLYFCGEMINVDGQLGGYNFQWAFASANTVALAIANACRS